MEIGALITAPDGTPVDGDHRSLQLVVKVNEHAYKTMPAEVVAMHTANGLLAESKASTLLAYYAGQQAKEWFLRQMEELRVRPNRDGRYPVYFAGSGIGHFDKRYLERYPYAEFNEKLGYPLIDVGVIRRTLHIAGMSHLIPGLDETKNHRALDDARLHAQEYAHYVRQLGSMVVAPAPLKCPHCAASLDGLMCKVCDRNLTVPAIGEPAIA